MIEFLKGILLIFGIVFLRFRTLPRLWNVWLVGVNLACLVFIQHPEAQVVLGTTAVAVILQGLIYRRMAFTRLLGIGHALWIPMFAWMATRLDTISADPGLESWLLVLALTNAVSMLIDCTDVARYLRGERAPHYSWA